MDAYGGFEPQVGEIRALRSFRVGRGGRLYALFHDQQWTEGTNSARCEAPAFYGSQPLARPAHHPPEPDCGCGFYAYAFAPGDAETPYADNVLAAVTCWGRVIAGTRGIRAEHSRIEAVWLSEQVPADLVAKVAERYPSVAMYSDKAAMLTNHPPTQLDCYEPERTRRPLMRLRVHWLLIALAVVATSLPGAWVASERGYLIGAVAGLLLLVSALCLPRKATVAESTRHALLTLAALLWIAAPFADRTGVLLLRIPLVDIAGLLCLQRALLKRAARQFPAAIG
jgi:hypothetical protein